LSHDREFLDRPVPQIVETERRFHHLPTTPLICSKAEALSSQLSAYERQQKELENSKFFDRFRASATRSTQAKSREKQLEKSNGLKRLQLD